MTKKKNPASAFKRTAAQASPRQPKLPSWVWLAGGGVVAVLLVTGLLYLGFQGPATANSGIEGVEILPNPGQGHQEGEIVNAGEVPAGGIHNARAVYDDARIHERAKLIGYAIDARKKRFPNEKPFAYRPQAGETYTWDAAAKASIKDYNLLDLSI